MVSRTRTVRGLDWRDANQNLASPHRLQRTVTDNLGDDLVLLAGARRTRRGQELNLVIPEGNEADAAFSRGGITMLPMGENRWGADCQEQSQTDNKKKLLPHRSRTIQVANTVKRLLPFSTSGRTCYRSAGESPPRNNPVGSSETHPAPRSGRSSLRWPHGCQ